MLPIFLISLILTIYSFISIYIRLDVRLLNFRIKYEKKTLRLLTAIPLFIISLFMAIIFGNIAFDDPTLVKVEQSPSKHKHLSHSDLRINEIELSERLIKKFKCELDEDYSNSDDFLISSQYISMQHDIDKVNIWFDHYKQNMPDFDESISETISKQLHLFENSCLQLGGKLGEE